MYIQEDPAKQERTAPPDYSGHTYVPPPAPPMPPEPPAADAEEELETEMEAQGEASVQKSTPAGAFSGQNNASFSQKEGKRGDFFGGLGLNGLFSRIPFLSSLAPPPRHCEQMPRKHGELWDWVLLAVVLLSLLNSKDDDVLPILLLLLLWD